MFSIALHHGGNAVVGRHSCWQLIRTEAGVSTEETLAVRVRDLLNAHGLVAVELPEELGQ